MALCDSCEVIKTKLCDYLDDKDVFLSKCSVDVDNIWRMRSSCSLCEFLTKVLELQDDGDKKPRSANLQIRTDRQGVLNIELPPAKSRRVAHLLQLEDGKRGLRGRKVADIFDVNLALGWMQRCEQWHGERCYTTGWPDVIGNLPSDRFRVLDVRRRCIAQGLLECKYVALSYVWGNVQVLQATKDNINTLSQAGALSRNILPQTIADAIEVVLALGLTYLWVDALCIVQDDPEDKHAQIMRMGAIYGHAVLTINAAAGLDANAGLPGVSHGSRQVDPLTYALTPAHTLSLAQPLLHEAADNSHWNKRGWTYQERFLSRRSLTFLRNAVFFECQRMLWCEDVVAELPECLDYFQMEDYLPVSWSTILDDDNHCYKLHYALHVQKSTNWTEYLRTVEEYTPRQLSYQSDAVNAFAGMNKALGRMFRSKMLFCMPESLFDCALLWQPAESLTRRRSVAGIPLFPSWCWPAWIGPIVHEDIMPHLKMLSPDLVSRTKPLVKWYKRRGDTIETTPIATATGVGSFILDQFKDAPPGWTVSTGSAYDIFSGTFFTHEDNPESYFIIPATHQTPENTDDGQWSKICGETYFSSALIAREGGTETPEEDSRFYTLFDTRESWVGFARFDTLEPLDSDGHVNVIILSEGATPMSEIERFWTVQEFERIRMIDSDWYQFYNVMLVIWSGSGLQRRGLGKIDKTKWSGIASERMNVIIE